MKEELIYLDFFGLKHNPFPLTPDVDYIFCSRSIDRIITEIVHGIVARKGFMVMVGEVGLGKTTISRKIMELMEDKEVKTALVFHTFFQEVDLLKEINRDFGLETTSDNLEGLSQLSLLNDFLLQKSRHGTNCAIIIDDAQNLSHKSLELIRMISNLEANREKLVQILLIGQPELLDKLNSHELRQLKSRIVIQKEVSPLNLEELEKYILFKLYAAGSQGVINLKKNAVRTLHHFTGGNMRQVNILMDRCLYAAYLHNTNTISRDLVLEAGRDLHITKASISRQYILAISLTMVVIFISIFLAGWNILKSDQQISSRTDTETQVVVPEQMISFLEAYGLSDFAGLLFNAIQNNRLEEAADDINNETGYQMIVLFEPLDSVRARFDILNLPPNSEGKELYILFWKPELEVDKFYWGYEGPEIVQLQKLLSKSDYYLFEEDGIVGKLLMDAVVRFQKDNDLAVTGFPDKTTIFLLSNKTGEKFVAASSVYE